ncbi:MULTISPECIES: flavin reductase family protein [Fusobacterium]|jgi:flavin reductase (DIM6/NTAB) family NADH-FMN oxidoreductase RutF|uniref:Flavin reductase family protein n=1 Tax=Fusobacterium varium ATCC 27725 TaxID=469618 RepID=A0ABN5JEF7_FUSVA|nr:MULTISPECIES: flavin reductase family protein [Fusobacterium]AVQ30214.1 flavin reductase family protein [Fusobacterium varium ATCC 27725]EES64755.1 flavin reductase-like protein [Fusobacterium varium ATCC 27725]MCD7979803.1 flavin reductase family protein [Fusobacterium sp.]MCF0170940.1 flavin reductase family protein [Fusobacterium varium]MCF2671890.1 flavin reductase family protein [Fusobacterium varium]
MKKNLFKGSVVLNPVPVVLVTSRNSEGKENVFTVAWTGTICTKPPMLSISIRPERLSYEYIKETMEFTVNLPTRKLTRETDYCGVRSGRTNNKIEEMKFTMIEGTEVKSSYIDECPVNIECKVKNIIPLGTHELFLAEVLCSHIDSRLLDENEKIHFEWANLISYSHGEYFPMPKEAIGSFGYSVAKKKTIEKKSISKKFGSQSLKNKKSGKKKVKNK